MSKKTRKKSPKPSSRSTAAKSASVRSPKATKARGAKTGGTKAAKPPKARKTTPRKASQTAPSKALKPGTLSEGAKAPAFHLPRDGGESVSLADFAGKKLVVFFYPRADTPG